MALSPSIPTSFVPKQPVSTNRRRSSGGDILMVISVILLIAAVVSSILVFVYNAYLQNVEKTKQAQLSQAQQQVSQDTVEQFVRLRNRLNASEDILSNHVALSQFFTLLEQITNTDVSFTSLNIQVADDRSAVIELQGEARNFNALAAESKTFASQKDIKSAIFTGIKINSDNTVGFTVDATLDRNLVVEGTPPVSASAPAASSTPISTALPTIAPLSTTTAASSTASSTKLHE